MRAVTWFGSTDSEMSSMASRLPYQAERFAISKLAAIVRRSFGRSRTWQSV